MHAVRMMLLFTAIGTLAGCHGAPLTVTTGALLDEMTDLRRLAEFPDPAFTCRQFSSYDRAAKSPTENWFANADVSQYLRVEENAGRKEWVMMDAAGPGAIVRIWSANPQGTLRIYLDGADTPVIETPMAEYLGGEFAGVPGPIAGERSRGWNSYFPIPYARHCKVTSDHDGFYYHVNYRTYAADTPVETFAAGDWDRLEGKIGHVVKVLSDPQEAQTTVRWGCKTRRYAAPGGSEKTGLDSAFLQSIAPGKSVMVADLHGSRAISRFAAVACAEDKPRALRQLVLEIDFDGEPAVRCPLGDFFGAAPGINPYASLPCGVTADGEMWAHWVMPFAESAEVRIRNLGDTEVGVAAEVVTIPYRWTDDSMHFHAKWRQSRDVPTRPMIDWNYLNAKGSGVFVGAAFAIANPVRAWWGEGDEKIYVDGETFPSHFGTGTEDYYGYAWCSNQPFTHAYHNQPRCDGPGNYGHTSVNRWHVLDRIPFTRDLRFDMELWHWTETVDVDMSVVAYWYARPGATDHFEAIDKKDVVLELMPIYVAPRVPGAIEGEEMRVISGSAAARPQDIRECSGEKHLWWHGGVAVGDVLTLGFDVEQAGRYRVLGRFVKAVDYGIARLSINGQSVGAAMDFFNDGVVVTDELDLGVFELAAGENQFSATVVGANERAQKSFMFGLDYLRLEPVP